MDFHDRREKITINPIYYNRIPTSRKAQIKQKSSNKAEKLKKTSDKKSSIEF